jgi:hypothetical protein
MLRALRLVIIALIPPGAPEHELKYGRVLRRLLAVANTADMVRDVLPAVKNGLGRFIGGGQDLSETSVK